MSITVGSATIAAQNTSPKVVVVGAGISGLTAAYRLRQQGMNVDVYEARGRVGGKIFTVNVGGNIAELGARNISDGGEAENLLRLISEFGLELDATRVGLNHYYFNGEDFFHATRFRTNSSLDIFLKNFIISCCFGPPGIRNYM